MLGFQSFRSASKTLKGIEAMNMVKKRQVNNLNYSVLNEVKYINQLFGIFYNVGIFPSDLLTFFILIDLHAYFEVFATEPHLNHLMNPFCHQFKLSIGVTKLTGT
jgi:hypothetical protein